MSDNIRRREFLRQIGAGVVGGTVVPALLRAQDKPASTQPATQSAVGTIRDLPTRRFGRIGLQLPVLSFGTAAMGHAFYEPDAFEEVVSAALAAGIRYIDTAPIYDVAEERLGAMMNRIRKDIFLVTKSHGRSRDEVLRDNEVSLKRLKTDHVDLAHLHNVGEITREQAIGKGGALDGLLDLKRQGIVRHIGCTGHLRPGRFIPVIETGAIEVLMVAMNFVDHHTYNFEEKVLPTARKHDCAIIAMKVYGGVTGGWDGYKNRRPGRLISDEDRQDAIDYALSIPGLATMVIGFKSLQELRLTIQSVRNHRPLEGLRREAVLAKGARLAKDWGEHFGPVV